MRSGNEIRPKLTGKLSAEEFRRWYWLKAELLAFARSRGIDATGGKQDVAERIAKSLAGEVVPSISKPTTPKNTPQLKGRLNDDTVIPEGQRLSTNLRLYFERKVWANFYPKEKLGDTFKFDGPMREFIKTGAGKTLGEACEHWHDTRGQTREIGSQFEYNRFTRAWHEANPNGPKGGARAAWALYRALPVDKRAEANLLGLGITPKK